MPTLSVTDERSSVKLEKMRDHHKARAAYRSAGFLFDAIDSEGSGKGRDHELVLLRCGKKFITNENGPLTYDRIFEFLYSCYKPRHVYVGFYLGYDFTQWLKSLPEERAKRLLTREGKASRKRKLDVKGYDPFWPVDVGKWQVDILGNKRLKIRPRLISTDKRGRKFDGVHEAGKPGKCPYIHDKNGEHPWMYICDAGPFFQSSFLAAINPATWASDKCPECKKYIPCRNHRIVSEEEYETIKIGKDYRSKAKLDAKMIEYNRLECEVLERLMYALQDGLIKMGIRLQPKQWFGPGQVAQQWLRNIGAITSQELNEMAEKDATKTLAAFLESARRSYFGGWFEIMAHGIVPGTTWSYDINSAYPHIIANLPCLKHGHYYSGSGKPEVTDTSLCLVYVTMKTKDYYEEYDENDLGSYAIGAMLHRDRHGRIARPFFTKGWIWKHELEAAMRAGCINHVEYHAWTAYEPCSCPPPLAAIKELYEFRLLEGKNTPQGKARKLGYNSAYGKFAQSIGDPKYGNPIYASLITAGCRTMILDAIATHPGGQKNVLMVATDGVYFLDKHPNLPLSKKLGEWEEEEHENLTLFKPGMYWDDEAREAIKQGISPEFKARGVSAKEFAPHIEAVDAVFKSWPKGNKDGSCNNMCGQPKWKPKGSGWPRVHMYAKFAMTSMTQAVQAGWEWADAGYVKEDVPLKQSPYHGAKRYGLWYDKERDFYRSKPIGDDWVDEFGPCAFDSADYVKRMGLDDPFSIESEERYGITPDGTVGDVLMDMIMPRIPFQQSETER